MLMNNSCNVSSSTSSSPNQYRGQQGAHEIQNFHHSGHHQGMPLRHNHESQLSYFWIKPFLSSRKEREKSILFASKKKKFPHLQQRYIIYESWKWKFIFISECLIVLLFIDLFILRTIIIIISLDLDPIIVTKA